jgi:hypothetical protein
MMASALPSPVTSAKKVPLVAPRKLLLQVSAEVNDAPLERLTTVPLILRAITSAFPSPVTSAKKVPFLPTKSLLVQLSLGLKETPLERRTVIPD